ncbi:MAG: integrase arm-type DNA-binding domain-containing protein [Thalassococcus sp.]|uniref:tyrosine-type recombinase/integrase n=1 Tax=Thalassococcus sp. TaxID=1928858 RepID=UPI001B1EA6EC|nr:integrase arm-type DNA-binding domain-containing protein [Thalassococcus sp.]MBO6867259.1 integrase arm-type DNA-binding domain-containing protein [Thalassococcus sp.]
MPILSDAKVRALKPMDKPYKRADFDGLFVLVNPNGSKLWRFKYRWMKKEKLLSFGKYPNLSLKQAREKRDAARKQLAEGKDPSFVRKKEKEREEAQHRETFGKLADALLEKKRKEGKSAATLAKTEWLHALLCADLGSYPISQLSARDVLVPLKKMEAKGRNESALRMRSAAGQIFRHAIALGLIDNDPTFGLRDALSRTPVKHRSAILDPEKVGGLLRAIEEFDGQPTTRIALQLLAMTALRPGELRMAEWAEIDLEKAIWTVPAHRAKMRRAHLIPLSDQALGKIYELQELTGWGQFLFPSIRSSKRCMSENTLNAALRRMGYSGDEMTAHGFRATFSTLANESGLWSADAIERALAHVAGNEIRKAYARGAYWDERVRIASWWASYLQQLADSNGQQ